MEQDTFETPVVFRADRNKNPEITAVFPCEPSDIAGHFMTCYAHIGQHSGCSYDWYNRTRAAKPDEYADLLAELIGLGYKPKVYKRIQPAHRAAFLVESERLRKRA